MVDTLSIAKELQEAGLSKKEAFAIASSIGRIMQTELASKKDLEILRSDLRQEILRANAAVQKELQEVKGDLQKEMNLIRADQQKDLRVVSGNTLKWVAGFMVGQTALLFTLVKLFN